MTASLGVTVGGCRLEEVIGRGGSGTVYRATQLALGRQVAVKLVPSAGLSPAAVARFEREARLAALLEHPNLVPIFAAGEEEGLLYLVMRWVQGRDLRALINQEGPLAPERAGAIIAQVAAALDAAHAAGLTHRDVKPANVLIERRAWGDHAYLSDFGLVRTVLGEDMITRTGEWVGTADYAAPEQLQGGHVDRRTDVYALAGMLYTALTARPPFVRDSAAAVAWAHMNAPPPAIDAGRAGWAGRVNRVIARGMAKAPEERYGSAGELAQDAELALAGTRPGAGRRPRLGRRGGAVAAACVLIATAAGVTVGLLLTERSGGRPGAGTTSGGTTSVHPPTAASVYHGPGFTIAYPAGWHVVEDSRPLDGFQRTAMFSPSGDSTLIVDRTPGETLSVQEKARSVESITSAHPGYYLYSLSPATLGGRRAVVWAFRLEAPPVARVDVFERLGNDGFAILAEGGSIEEVRPTAIAAASSLQAR